MTQLSLIQIIAVAIIPVLFAITVHEVCHGWVAKHLGDKTAERLGRLTLNPFKHIDPVGTVLVPGLLLLMKSPFIFGWAKPVPVNWENLNHPKRDMAIVAAAGPLSNLLMAFLWGLVMKITLVSQGISPDQIGKIFTQLGQTQSLMSPTAQAFWLMGIIGVSINLVLMLLNLIPIPPLDGSRVVASFMSDRTADKFYRMAPFGFFILVALLLLGILQYLLVPPFLYIFHFILSFYGLTA